VRRVGIGGWGVELFRRTTLLVDTRGIVAAVWSRVKVRGHAAEVLAAARRLAAPPA
jgi:peroxiredoxin